MLASTQAQELGWSVLLDNAFTLTLLLIFAAVLATTLVRRYRRDKCLMLLDDFHATFADAHGRALWGDLVVVPGGLEVRFDTACVGRSGLTKSSALIYEEVLHAGVGLCRSVDALTPDERLMREAQIRRTIRPGPVRLVLRALVNFCNALRDSLARTFTLAVTEVASAIPIPTAITRHPDRIDALGSKLERTVSRAYDPLLERWIGRPVVVRLWSAAAPEHPVELPGYLVEYTEDYLAVFNLVRERMGELELEVRGDLHGEGFMIEWRPPRVRIHCTGPDVLVVEEVRTSDGTTPVDCALLRGTFAELRTGDAEQCTVKLHRTQRVDMVCPRARAIVTHGGEWVPDEDAPGLVGCTPCTYVRGR